MLGGLVSGREKEKHGSAPRLWAGSFGSGPPAIGG